MSISPHHQVISICQPCQGTGKLNEYAVVDSFRGQIPYVFGDGKCRHCMGSGRKGGQVSDYTSQDKQNQNVLQRYQDEAQKQQKASKMPTLGELLRDAPNDRTIKQAKEAQAAMIGRVEDGYEEDDGRVLNLEDAPPYYIELLRRSQKMLIKTVKENPSEEMVELVAEIAGAVAEEKVRRGGNLPVVPEVVVPPHQSIMPDTSQMGAHDMGYRIASELDRIRQLVEDIKYVGFPSQAEKTGWRYNTERDQKAQAIWYYIQSWIDYLRGKGL